MSVRMEDININININIIVNININKKKNKNMYTCMCVCTWHVYVHMHLHVHFEVHTLLTSIAADTSTRTRKIQYMMYFIFKGFTMSAGISFESKAT